MRKQSWVILILAILLVVALAFISYIYYQSIQIQKQETIANQAAQFGYEQAIIQVMQQASTCQQVPLVYNNQTLNVVAVECLQAAQQQQAQANQGQ